MAITVATKKTVYLDKNANRELHQFPESVQIEFVAYFKILSLEGKLDFPEARKIDRNLYELRIKLLGAYRGFYAYIGKTSIIILHCFQKKTNKTPLKDIKTAKTRLRQYE